MWYNLKCLPSPEVSEYGKNPVVSCLGSRAQYDLQSCMHSISGKVIFGGVGVQNTGGTTLLHLHSEPLVVGRSTLEERDAIQVSPPGKDPPIYASPG